VAVKGGFALDSLPTQNPIAKVLQFNYKTCSRCEKVLGNTQGLALQTTSALQSSHKSITKTIMKGAKA